MNGEKNKVKCIYFILYVIFILYNTSCATNRNNGIGNGKSGDAYIESARISGEVSAGIETIERSNESVAEKVDGIIESVTAGERSQQDAIDGNTRIAGAIEGAIRLNNEILEIIRRIRNGENNSSTGSEAPE